MDLAMTRSLSYLDTSGKAWNSEEMNHAVDSVSNDCNTW
jgi:hypothetical protein